MGSARWLACLAAAGWPLAAALVTAPGSRQDAERLAATEEWLELLAIQRPALPEAARLLGGGWRGAGSALQGGPGVHSAAGPTAVTSKEYATAVASYLLLWSILIAFTGFLYRRCKVWPKVDENREFFDSSKFSSGPFDCFQDGWCNTICLWSCLCPCVRWADNVSMLGILNFWLALALMGTAWMLNGLPGGALIWLLSAFVWMMFRQRFRQKFGMDGQNECSYYLGDCVLYLFCAPCAVAQEARHLDEAARADIDVVKEHRPKDASEAEQA